MTTDVILAALRAAPDGLTRSELFAAASRKCSAEQLTAALKDLESRGVVRSERTQPPRGRPAEVWRITSPTGSHSNSVKSEAVARATTPRDTLQEMADRWFASQRQRLGLEVRR